MKILVSACLLGIGCRFDGANQQCQRVVDLAKRHELIPVCPEIYGGLPTPRQSAEIVCGRVITKSGRDVTAQYKRGAEECTSLCRKIGCKVAILKERSPSCGSSLIHNGLFDNGLIPGRGIFADMLASDGITLYSEFSEQLDSL